MNATAPVLDAALGSWVTEELAKVRRRLDNVAAELRRRRTTADMELLGAEHALRRAAFLLDGSSEITRTV